MNINLSSNAAQLMAELAGKAAKMHIAAEEGGKGAVSMIVAQLPSNMHWKKPTGALAGSFSVRPHTGGAEGGTDLPYGRRREFGFSGRTDSLGRYYANDPGAFYIQTTITQLGDKVLEPYIEALEELFG